MAYPKRKYRKGFTIFSMTTLVYEHLQKGCYVFLRDKVVHPSVILHMLLGTVKALLDDRLFSEAIDQHKEWAEGKYHGRS